VNDLLENGFLVASEDYEGWAQEDGALSRVSSEDDPRVLAGSSRRERAEALRSRRLGQRVLDLEGQVGSLRGSLREMQESSTWRYTAPLRWLVDGAKRARNRLR
jgi:hypothetical protein